MISDEEQIEFENLWQSQGTSPYEILVSCGVEDKQMLQILGTLRKNLVVKLEAKVESFQREIVRLNENKS